MSSRNWPIGVRLARPADREAVLAFATNTWHGWDYIPEVWDAWMVPTDGFVLVATVAAPLHGDEPRDAAGAPLAVGQPVAMTRIAMLSADEAWLEGIRVDPRVQGLGVATDLQVAELHWIEAHHARVVRYMTGEQNVGSQRLGAHHGLLEIGRWRTWARPEHGHDPGRMEAALSGMGKAGPDAWPLIHDDATCAAARGLYEYRPWAFQELTEARFRRHVDRDEARMATSAAGWAALIVNRHRMTDGDFHVALAAGDGTVFLELLRALEWPEFRLPDPDPPLLRGAAERFAAEGYAPWDHSAIVVERILDTAGQPPERDPRRLLLTDEPRRMAVARGLG